MFFKTQTKTKLYVSWVGLRGAVPIVFATYPLLAGIEKAHMIFYVVFFISVTSVLIQGTTLSLFAKWLDVSEPEIAKKPTEVDKLVLELPKSSMQELVVLPNYFAVDKRIVDLHFPNSAFIIMVKRNREYIRPGGSTVLKANDVLMVIADKQEDFDKVRYSLEV